MEGKEVFDGVGPRADTVGATCATVPGSVQGREDDAGYTDEGGYQATAGKAKQEEKQNR